MSKITVVEIETQKTVKTIDCKGKSERAIEKIEFGMLRNMDLEKYCTIIKD